MSKPIHRVFSVRYPVIYNFILHGNNKAKSILLFLPDLIKIVIKDRAHYLLLAKHTKSHSKYRSA